MESHLGQNPFSPVKPVPVPRSPGTLYGALSRLEQYGLIAALPADERRRPYRLTAQGTAFLRQYLTSLEKFVSLSLKRLEA